MGHGKGLFPSCGGVGGGGGWGRGTNTALGWPFADKRVASSPAEHPAVKGASQALPVDKGGAPHAVPVLCKKEEGGGGGGQEDTFALVHNMLGALVVCGRGAAEWKCR